MSLKLGNTAINKMYLGSTLVNKVYLGGTLVHGVTAPTNHYTTANAANPDNEVDATTGTIVNTTVSWASVASSPTPQNGSYCLLMTHTGTDNTQCKGEIEIGTTEIGATYQVDLYVQEVVGSNWQWELHTADGWLSTVSGGNIVADSVWTLVSLTGEADAVDATIRFLSTSAGDNGNQLAIDNIVITKL